jgi:hypothetical protein
LKEERFKEIILLPNAKMENKHYNAQCTEKEKADEFWPMNECSRMIHPVHVVLFTLLGNMSCPE